jgi:WD40 repeat protein
MVVTEPSPEAQLGRTEIKSALVQTPFSAASLQTTRLAAIDKFSFVFATGKSVFRLQCSQSRKRSRPAELFDINEPAGQSDYLTPANLFSLEVEPVVHHSTHRREVTALAVEEDRCASIDADGACVLSFGGFSGEGSSAYALHPPSLSFGEPGWSGVALQPGNVASTATARQYYRDVSLYDRDILVRTIHTLVEPAGVSFLGSTASVAVLEGSAIALYDWRAAERASCTTRKLPSSSQLLSLDASPDGSVVAVAGKDRTVHVFDSRTLTFRDRWPSCLKYECAGVKLSRLHDGMAYVCGVDNEVSFGAYCPRIAAQIQTPESLMMSGANAKSPRRAFGFRGDVRITGMDCVSDSEGEVIAAISESGAFYRVETPTTLPKLQPE